MDFCDFFDTFTPNLFNYKTETFKPNLFKYKTDTYKSNVNVYCEFTNDLSKKFEVVVTLPGFSKENVSVSRSENKLIVRAKNNNFKDFGDYEGTFDLTSGLGNPEIHYSDGVLHAVFKKESKETELEVL